MWILAVLLLGLIAALGYMQGAVRLGVSLIGLFLGVLLAAPLAPAVRPLVAMAGVTHAIWLWVLPPIIVFLIVLFVFMGVSFVVHRKIELYHKYRSNDLDRFRFERLNKRLGICMGMVMGVVWFYLLGAVVYSTGYLTTQVASEETDSTAVRLVNQARIDLRETGMDASVGAFDPMPRDFYVAADILGLIRQNPIVLSRLSQYPDLLALGEREEVQEIATDSEFNNLLLTKADLIEIIRHPKSQTILQNKEVIQELVSQDFKDLRQYLETGVSPKFEDEEILGRWELNFYATMMYERKKRPNMKSSEMLRLRKMLTEMMPAVTVVAMPDNKVKVKTEITESMKQLAEAAQAAAAARAQGGVPMMDPQMAQRYGIGQRGRFSAPEGEEGEGQPQTDAPKQLVHAAEGNWERGNGHYQLQLQDEAGQTQTWRASADPERLLVHSPAVTMVFYNAD